MELDVDVVDAIFSSGRYPAGKLPYNKFHFEMQLLAPYAGDDNQAYLHKWREEFRAKVADAKAKKGEEKAKADAILDAKKKADNAARVPPDSQLNPNGPDTKNVDQKSTGPRRSEPAGVRRLALASSASARGF